MPFKVYPYNQGSRSAKALAEALEGKVLKHVGSKYRPRRGDVVINWGASNLPDFAPATTLNSDVRNAQCKVASLKALHQAGVSVPDFVADGQNRFDPNRTAKDAAAAMGFPVVCRTKLRGHSGDGIVVANTPEELVDAPLYTKYIKKKDEYRVHVVRDKHVPGLGLGGPLAFFVQRKARKLDVENPNWQVRNLEGGFVFVEVQVEDVPQDVIHQAERALEALDLDFGGVDVIFNDREQRAYVLEVNTACGLEPRTAEHYSRALLQYSNNL